jgi:hypothetical protein
MQIQNIHVVELAELISDVGREIEKSQSASRHRLKQKDGMRFGQYFSHMANVIQLIKNDPEKDNPHSHPEAREVKPMPVPDRGMNIFCNLLCSELYNMHIELTRGNSKGDSAGLVEPDVEMLDEKLKTCSQYLSQGLAAKPNLHFIESVRGDADDGAQ